MVSDTIAVDLPHELPSNHYEEDEQFRFVRSMLPMVVSWPRGASRSFIAEVYTKYFRGGTDANRFRYSVLVHRAETPCDGVRALSDAGAFATRAGREALLSVVEEAQSFREDGRQLCKGEVLDVLVRFARGAFVLDGTDMTCGALPE